MTPALDSTALRALLRCCVGVILLAAALAGQTILVGSAPLSAMMVVGTACALCGLMGGFGRRATPATKGDSARFSGVVAHLLVISRSRERNMRDEPSRAPAASALAPAIEAAGYSSMRRGDGARW